MEGEFTYDTATSDYIPDDPSYGGYWHDPPFSPNGLTIKFGVYTFVADPNQSFKVNVFNDYSDYNDTLAFGPEGFVDPIVDPIQGSGPALPYPLDSMAFGFWDSTGSAFSSDALPASLNLADFDRFLDTMGSVELQSLEAAPDDRVYFPLDTLAPGTPSQGGGVASSPNLPAS